MARIAGVDLPRDKRVEVGLTYIYGIGRPTSNKILKELNINPDTRVKDLTENEVNALRNILDEKYTVEVYLSADRKPKPMPAPAKVRRKQSEERANRRLNHG